MQLPARGHPLHTRALTIGVTQADDGRWRARGDVIDLRKCSFVPMHADLQPAGIIHQMSIEMDLDPASRRIGSIQTDQPCVAVEPSAASNGECCRDPAPRLQAMVGETLDDGFSKRLSAVFGGPRGCSHLLTLFQLMASALPRALDQDAALRALLGESRDPGEPIFRRAAFVDGHQIDETRIGVEIQLADFLTTPHANVVVPLDRLAWQTDARAHAEVSRESIALVCLEGATRERTGKDLASARWRDRSADLADLVGAPVMGGLAGRLFRLLGRAPEDRVLLDALLQLAPGYIQVMATMMERWIVAEDSPLRMLDGEAPAVSTVGGTPDSCYMWRVGGPLAATPGATPPARREEA